MNSLWNRYQDWLYLHPGLGLYLDVSRMRFDPDLLERLKPGFVKAFDAMEALERGSVANPDEQRMVGHYWLRQPDLAANRRGVLISGDQARPASLMVSLKQLVPVT